MGEYTRIPADTFKQIQFNSGMVLSDFNPASPDIDDDDILAVTTGGIKIDVKPEFIDLGEDVDNCPVNMMELKEIDDITAQLSFTALSFTPKGIQIGLGGADITPHTTSMLYDKITPRRTLEADDFTDVYWVGDMMKGGFACCKLSNALSTDGLSISTTKKGKGQMAVTLTGHFSMDAQDVVPVEFYILQPASSSGSGGSGTGGI